MTPEIAQRKIPTVRLSSKIVLKKLHYALFPDTDVPERLGDKFDNVFEYLDGHNLLPWSMPSSEINQSRVRIHGRQMLVFSSYSYLGLIDDNRVLRAGLEAAARYGVGSHGVRVLTGHSDVHHALESKVAAFLGREDALVFSSGYLANLGVISGLVEAHDHILIDELAHASLVQGSILSGATTHRFRHNDFEDVARICEKILRDKKAESQIYLITDSVFSMDGDLLDLPRAVGVKRVYGVKLIIDEAHGIACIGARGRGIEDHFNLPGVIDVQIGTFSKGIPSAGGFVAADRKTIRFLRYIGAAPMVFSAPLSPFHCGAALKALEILDESPELVATLSKNSTRLRTMLTQAGFDVGKSESPIVPLMLGSEMRTLRIWRQLFDKGFLTAAVIAPAVALGKARLRLTAHAGHQPVEIENFVACLSKVFRDDENDVA